MSTQTNHLGLHQWEAEDKFLRADFNEDFGKIDAGVKTVADALTTEAAARQSADSAINAALESETAAREAAVAAVWEFAEGSVVTQTYTTNPAESIPITLGFRPKFVALGYSQSVFTGMVFAVDGVAVNMILNKNNVSVYMKAPVVAFTDTGFVIRANEPNINQNAGDTITYAAFR